MNEIETLFHNLTIKNGLKCCLQKLVATTDGFFRCSKCNNVWSFDSGNWNDNILHCCNQEIFSKNGGCNGVDLPAFYCERCCSLSQVCCGCNEMMNNKQLFYHHLCADCFDKELQK